MPTIWRERLVRDCVFARESYASPYNTHDGPTFETYSTDRARAEGLLTRRRSIHRPRCQVCLPDGPKAANLLVMLRTVGTLLLLLQLRPFAAAAVCLHQSQGAEQPCDMPMGAAPTSNDQGQRHSTRPSQSPGCPLAQLCALSAPVVVPAVLVGPTVRVTVASVAPVYVASNHTAEPVAPPVPPPNS